MKCDFENTIAFLPQSWNWLENRGGENNKVSKRVWKVVETKAGKTGVAEAKERREKRKEGKK